MNRLRKGETWQVIPKPSLPHKEIFLSGRSVLNLKSFGSADERAKARYVSKGNCDREKARMFHNVDITTLRQSSTRIIVSVSAIKLFLLSSHDVRQAYLENEDKLTRKVFLLPKRADIKYFGLCEGGHTQTS